MKIPLSDIKPSDNITSGKIEKTINDVIKSGSFVGAPWIDDFESAFSKYLDIKYAVALSSGTAALHLALLSCGIGPGDEVITSAHTFIATLEAICYTGSKPVLADIDGDNFNIDLGNIESKITSKTKAILPVHLYGQPADMGKLLELAKRNNLRVIEDACQAHGAEYKIDNTWKKTGTLGNAGCFSFYPTKNLGAYGDAGMLVTNDKNIAETAIKLRNHGQDKRYEHPFIGYNYRMSAIQAAILKIKLDYLDEWNNKRREITEYYSKLIKNPRIQPPKEMNYARHVYHLYVIKTKNRNNLKNYLEKNGINSGIYYHIPAHLQPAFSFLNYKKGDFPVTEKCADESLALPMYPDLSKEQIEYISNKINSWK